MPGSLYYGDNLDITRRYIEDRSIDLVYLDPPFNSKAEYNVLFNEPGGKGSAAQVMAFSDFWKWDEKAQESFDEIVTSNAIPVPITEIVRAFHHALGPNDMLAYLVMMTIRLVELHRVLKPGGSLYLHCDPVASHYLKVILDRLFDPKNFQREIAWRTGWVSGFKTSAKNWIRNHDILLFYSKGKKKVFNKQFIPHAAGYKRRGGGENPKGVAIDDVWTDIYSPWIMSFSKEKLGYQTQKPLALLERILEASSNPGDIVLDPFCGCGTTIVASEKLGREWIGIDITHLAINLIRFRLRDSFGISKLKAIGEPVDLSGANALAREDRYQFEVWALGLVGARPKNGPEKRGADKGIDGYMFFPTGTESDSGKIIVQVKSGHVGVSIIRDLRGAMEREGAEMGLLVTLESPTAPMKNEALQAGYYQHPTLEGVKYPRIQISTIQELLQGKLPKLPHSVMSGRKTAKQEINEPQIEFMMP